MKQRTKLYQLAERLQVLTAQALYTSNPERLNNIYRQIWLIEQRIHKLQKHQTFLTD